MDRRATEGAYLIDFGGRCIDYRFVRRRRRTIGITIDANGLSVAAPLRTPWREVEAFLRQKERWIKRKLEEWARLPRPPIVRGHSGESLPLFGSLVTLEVRTGSRRAVHHQRQRLLVTAPSAQRTTRPISMSRLRAWASPTRAPNGACAPKTAPSACPGAWCTSSPPSPTTWWPTR